MDVFAMDLINLSHHGNISVQKLPQICTFHIVKMGEIWGWSQNDKKVVIFNISP